MGRRESEVVSIAESGAELAAERFRTVLQVETKSSQIDPVTEVDRETQSRIVATIEELFPDDTIVAEEDDALKRVPENGYAWVIDPIDGTLNYSRGLGVWVTSVAVIEDQTPIATVNVVPQLNEQYTATSDGATLNGMEISVSETTDPASFLVGSTLRLHTDEHQQFGVLADTVIDRFGEFRRTGSAQLTLSLVASGALDALIGLKQVADPWDTIAGVFHVRQAGGTVTDIHGNQWNPGSEGLVASNGRLHGDVVDVAQETLGLD